MTTSGRCRKFTLIEALGGKMAVLPWARNLCFRPRRGIATGSPICPESVAAPVAAEYAFQKFRAGVPNTVAEPLEGNTA